jgi:hypothetical protein
VAFAYFTEPPQFAHFSFQLSGFSISTLPAWDEVLYADQIAERPALYATLRPIARNRLILAAARLLFACAGRFSAYG